MRPNLNEQCDITDILIDIFILKLDILFKFFRMIPSLLHRYRNNSLFINPLMPGGNKKVTHT